MIEIPQLHLFLNRVYEATIINFEKRTELLKIRGAHNRLATYETTHPEFIGRISNKQIASYLNLSPETLSRAKSKEYSSRNV